MRGEKNWSHVSLVWRCWVLGVGVMWCCAVMFPEEGLDLLTACLQTVGGRYLLQQFHHSPLNSFHPILLSISSFGETTLHLRIQSWFYQTPLWVGGLAVWLAFPSFLFRFGIVRLVAPTAIENISVGKLAPLSRKLPNLHHMEGVTQVLETLKC